MTEDYSSINVLVIDDEKDHAESTAEVLERVGYHCAVATEGREGLEKATTGGADIVITDLKMHDVDGMEILKAVKDSHPETEVIMITGHGSVDSAVEAMNRGARTYITKPLNIDELRAHVSKAAERVLLNRRNLELSRQVDEKFGFEGIIGNSKQMHDVFETVTQIAPTSATVLIQGESGTGKELIAYSIHNNSPRKSKPFVAVSCAALAEGILESELFGHEKGSFTGAVARRVGRFEYANGGTLFLDEVGDMPLPTQVKFLRVLESRQVTRLGSNTLIPVDVRLVAATNKDLEEEVKAGRFREELYFRLNVVSIKIPLLKERREDIPLLIDAFINEFSQLHKKAIQGITKEARAFLWQHDWPGNVRELKNCIESMVAVTRDDVLDVDDIPEHLAPPALSQGKSRKGSLASSRLDLQAGISMEDAERQLIKETLTLTNGNREKAAKILKIGERTLYRKLDRYGLK